MMSRSHPHSVCARDVSSYPLSSKCIALVMQAKVDAASLAGSEPNQQVFHSPESHVGDPVPYDVLFR